MVGLRKSETFKSAAVDAPWSDADSQSRARGRRRGRIETRGRQDGVTSKSSNSRSRAVSR